MMFSMFPNMFKYSYKQKPKLDLKIIWEEEIKVAEQEDLGLAFPHEHVKNTLTYGAILTENKLETGIKTLTQQSYKE